jgi:hypothetical protein
VAHRCDQIRKKARKLLDCWCGDLGESEWAQKGSQSSEVIPEAFDLLDMAALSAALSLQRHAHRAGRPDAVFDLRVGGFISRMMIRHSLPAGRSGA